MSCKVYGQASDARHEASVLRALEHPNIVRSLGAGSAGYVLMEYLDGPTLNAPAQPPAARATGAGGLAASLLEPIGRRQTGTQRIASRLASIYIHWPKISPASFDPTQKIVPMRRKKVPL